MLVCNKTTKNFYCGNILIIPHLSTQHNTFDPKVWITFFKKKLFSFEAGDGETPTYVPM